MKDVFEQDSSRPKSQLLGEGADDPYTNLQKAEDEGFKIPDQLDDQSMSRSEAEGMVHYLLVQSKKPALLVDSKWTLPGEKHDFPQEPVFREVAEKAGFVTHLQTCPDQSGTRHLLFIGRSADLKDADYLECLPSSFPHLC